MFWNIFLNHHLRSFCLSFFSLAFVLTLINFLSTTTTIHKSTTKDFLFPLNSTETTIQPSSLLSLNSFEVRRRRFHCYERHFSPTIESKENFLRKTIELIQPNRTTFDEDFLPYDYQSWRSSPLMPRVVTPCEHRLMIKLLKRFDQLTKKYSLDYMIIDGTLLGSWRHHDLIPWDDDIDLMMSVRLKDRLNRAIQLESSSPYLIEFHHRWDAPKAFEYYKFYFSISPRYSEYPWRYPFVDLIFYHENSTHLWQENLQETTSILKEKIFPLKYRPLGPLWLPAPRSPLDYFLSVGWTNVDEECFNGPWSHKYERTKDFDYGNQLKSNIDCDQLKSFYPFVHRKSTTRDEDLILNGTVIQRVHITH